MRLHLLVFALSLAAVACAGPRFVAIPASINVDRVPKQIVEMTAKKYEFTPAEVRVKQGVLVSIEIESLDVTHGFALDAFGIDESIAQGSKKTIRFYAAEKGEYPFHCSHFCGAGHFGMKGRIVVE